MQFAYLPDLMYYVVINTQRRYIMKGIVAFLKDIFTFSDDEAKVGLSQFKMSREVKRPAMKKVVNQSNEVKLSDLMRRSY